MRRVSVTNLAVGLVILLAGLTSGCGYNDLQGLDEDTKAAWKIGRAHV